ncbi:MAG: hypothetical protein GY774_25720 [Planctomycetes bacterium]|nr:hypothetical protein [Planctomycetota bacterium]
MKKILSIILLTSMCCFAGCTSYWYQEGKTYEECSRDLRECRSEMQKYSDKGYNLGVYDLKFEKECMGQKGYRLVKERDLPLRVRRQGPASSEEGYHGVAGILEE